MLKVGMLDHPDWATKRHEWYGKPDTEHAVLLITCTLEST